MYKCNTCSINFIQPEHRTVDAGGIRDTGIIGKSMVTFIGFCPNCNSRDYEKEGEHIETRQTINKDTEGVLIGSWPNY